MHDRGRADEPVQDRLVQYGYDMRGPGTVEDGLPFQPRRNQLISSFGWIASPQKCPWTAPGRPLR
ncbi:MAG: hypothetical protein ABSF03_29965 [Streptosporangiaceae bacterium]|jgi:hypothetical protein